MLPPSTPIAQSPSHSLSHPLKGMASQHLRRSATEAQLGLEVKVELECALKYEVEFELKFESPS